ncbi:MAG: hypothetical protein ACT4OM_04310 [Actinomycetota bacterium]
MADDDFVASPGSPRIYELIQDAPGKNNRDRVGGDNSVWAWPEVTEFLKIAGQPVPGPWPPHQEPRPDPEVASAEAVAVSEPDQQLRDIARKRGDAPPEDGASYARWRRGGDAPDYGSAASSPGGYGKPTLSATEVAKKHHAATGSKSIWNDTASIWKGGSLKDLDPNAGE